MKFALGVYMRHLLIYTGVACVGGSSADGEGTDDSSLGCCEFSPFRRTFNDAP